MTPHTHPIILTEQQVHSGVQTVAAALNARYHDAVVITVVPGGILFTADVVRKLTFDVSMDTLSCPHTPGQRANASPIVFRNSVSIAGRDVIVMDDAIESGGTMKRVVEHLHTHFSPKSLIVATLFVKPGRVDVGAEVFYAYEMANDDLLIGYGLPWEHKYRNLPYMARFEGA